MEKREIIKTRLWIWPLIFIFVFSIVVWNIHPNPSLFGKFLTFMWCFLYLPALTFEILGFTKGDLKLAGSHPTSKKVIIQITTIARENTLPALNRTIESVLKQAPEFLMDWHIDLLTEEQAEGLSGLQKRWANEEKIKFIAKIMKSLDHRGVIDHNDPKKRKK